MRAESRSRIGVLVGVLVVVAAMAAWHYWPAGGTGEAGVPGAAPTAGRAAPTAGRASASLVRPEQLDVAIDKLERDATARASTGRDPFRFGAPPPPPAVPVSRPDTPDMAGPTTPLMGGEGLSGPAPVPPPPPITLKFIGLLSEGTPARKIAVLSDGRFVFQGREGDIIEGRYRVVRIGDESVQLEYLDGRGRQTIRLSGA